MEDSLFGTLPHWSKLTPKVEKSANQVMILGHMTTKHKLVAAGVSSNFMHQLYQKEGWFTATDQFLIRVFAENIFFHLSSCLDALGHEVSQIFQVQLPFERVQIDHMNNQKNCLRCLLQRKDVAFASFLDSELPQKGSQPGHWYHAFTEYRNQVVHRTLYVVLAGPKAMVLPDNPTNLNPRVSLKDHTSPTYYFDPDYHEQREIRKYTLDCIYEVRDTVEKIYAKLDGKI